MQTHGSTGKQALKAIFTFSIIKSYYGTYLTVLFQLVLLMQMCCDTVTCYGDFQSAEAVITKTCYTV